LSPIDFQRNTLMKWEIELILSINLSVQACALNTANTPSGKI